MKYQRLAPLSSLGLSGIDITPGMAKRKEEEKYI